MNLWLIMIDMGLLWWIYDYDMGLCCDEFTINYDRYMGLSCNEFMINYDRYGFAVMNLWLWYGFVLWWIYD